MLQRLLKASRVFSNHAGFPRELSFHGLPRQVVLQSLDGESRLLHAHVCNQTASNGARPVLSSTPSSQQVWLSQPHWQHSALAYSTDAGPIKSKGMTAGTLPPAADQVPPDKAQTPIKEQDAAAVRQSLEAASERDRPASKAGPPGLDQVPATAQSESQDQQPAEPIVGTGAGANAAFGSATDSESAGQPLSPDASSSLQPQGESQQSTASSNRQQPSVGGWQRFKWLLWGTPAEYWKRGQPLLEQPANRSRSSGSSSSSTSSSNSSSSRSSKDSNSNSTTSTPSGAAADADRSEITTNRLSLAGFIERALMRTRVIKDEDVARFASKSAAIAVYTLAGFSVLGTLGVDTKPLVAGLGVGGFTVGFALRDVATNFVSGVLLVLQRPFEKGDRVRVHAGSTPFEGIIHSIDLRYIIISAKDNTTVMIPASIVYANPVVVLKK